MSAKFDGFISIAHIIVVPSRGMVCIVASNMTAAELNGSFAKRSIFLRRKLVAGRSLPLPLLGGQIKWPSGKVFVHLHLYIVHMKKRSAATPEEAQNPTYELSYSAFNMASIGRSKLY